MYIHIPNDHVPHELTGSHKTKATLETLGLILGTWEHLKCLNKQSIMVKLEQVLSI